MVYSVINLSQLEGALRLDAEFYQPEYLDILLRIKNKRKKPVILKSIILKQVVTGTTPKNRITIDDGTDIFFIKTDVVRDGRIEFSHADKLPVAQSRRNSEPKKGDILVTIIGATHEVVGRSAMVDEGDPRMNINQNIALIRPDPEIVEPEYLETYLRSKYGRDQLWRLSRRTEQVNLNCREIEDIYINVLEKSFQRYIKNLIQNSHQQRNNSILYFAQAQELLLTGLGLKDFSFEAENYNEVNLSSVQQAHRLDAEFFQKKYEILKNKLLSLNSQKLSSVIDIIPAVFNPATKPDSIFKYVELANINANIGTIDGFTPVTGKEAPGRAKRILTKDDVIISSIEGSLDKVALVSESEQGFLASTGFFQLRSERISPEVLLILANSLIFQLQLKQLTAGSILTAVPKETIKEILVPVLPKDIQQQIAKLVKDSHLALKKSKELLAQAKTEVEQMIDNYQLN